MSIQDDETIRATRYSPVFLLTALLFVGVILAPGQVAADDDGCFRLPNGTKFCAKPPARDRTSPGAGQKKPGREVASDRRGQAGGNRQGNSGAGSDYKAVRAAGGLAFLVEQFDVSRIPSLEVSGPCLCRDSTEPVYGFCTEGTRTYKASCS